MLRELQARREGVGGGGGDVPDFRVADDVGKMWLMSGCQRVMPLGYGGGGGVRSSAGGVDEVMHLTRQRFCGKLSLYAR